MSARNVIAVLAVSAAALVGSSGIASATGSTSVPGASVTLLAGSCGLIGVAA